MRKLSLLAALLLVVACSSSSLGDLGSIFGTPTNTNQQNSVQATVNFIDTTNQRIDPTEEGGRSKLEFSAAPRAVVTIVVTPRR